MIGKQLHNGPNGRLSHNKSKTFPTLFLVCGFVKVFMDSQKYVSIPHGNLHWGEGKRKCRLSEFFCTSKAKAQKVGHRFLTEASQCKLYFKMMTHNVHYVTL